MNPGDVGGVRLAWAVDGRADSTGGLCGALASMEELRAGLRIASVDVVGAAVAAVGRPLLLDTDDFVDRRDVPRVNAGLSFPNATVPVDWLDSTELERDRSAFGATL